MGARIPVHVVTGPRGSGKTALIARFCAGRDDWLGLVDALPDEPPAGLRAFSAGCPCCTGKVVLQVSLARGLRESRATRAFVELRDPAHRATLERLLAELPLSLSVVPGRPIELPADASLQAATLEG